MEVTKGAEREKDRFSDFLTLNVLLSLNVLLFSFLHVCVPLSQ
jgi:hypothetical protein